MFNTYSKYAANQIILSHLITHILRDAKNAIFAIGNDNYINNNNKGYWSILNIRMIQITVGEI